MARSPAVQVGTVLVISRVTDSGSVASTVPVELITRPGTPLQLQVCGGAGGDWTASCCTANPAGGWWAPAALPAAPT